MSLCLDVIPGNEEKERDDNRDWSSDVASNLSMAVKDKTNTSVCVAGKDETPPLSTTGREGGRKGEMTTLEL